VVTDNNNNDFKLTITGFSNTNKWRPGTARPQYLGPAGVGLRKHGSD
jgi:hypothetical protein